MRMTIDIDCTPEEARRLFGLPDITPINEKIVEEMARRANENMDSLADPERFLSEWMGASGKGFEQFQQMMSMAMSGGSQSEPSKKK